MYSKLGGELKVYTPNTFNSPAIDNLRMQGYTYVESFIHNDEEELVIDKHSKLFLSLAKECNLSDKIATTAQTTYVRAMQSRGFKLHERTVNLMTIDLKQYIEYELNLYNSQILLVTNQYKIHLAPLHELHSQRLDSTEIMRLEVDSEDIRYIRYVPDELIEDVTRTLTTSGYKGVVRILDSNIIDTTLHEMLGWKPTQFIKSLNRLIIEKKF